MDEIIKKERITKYPYENFENIHSIETNFYTLETSVDNIESDNNFLYKALIKKTRTLVILKPISINNLSYLKEIIDKIKQYRKLEAHENVSRILGITKSSSNNYMLVLENADGTTLHNYFKENVRNNKTISWTTKLHLVKQIANGLMFLHSKDIVHGNLNPISIFIHKDQVKLIDGASLNQIFSGSSDNRIHEIFGKSLQYSDSKNLEILLPFNNTKKSFDIYSLGIILWLISDGYFQIHPERFNEKFELLEKFPSLYILRDIIYNKKQLITSGTPLEYTEIYKNCWQPEEFKRPNIEQVIRALNEKDLSNMMKSNIRFVPKEENPNISNKLSKLDNDSNIENKKFLLKHQNPLKFYVKMKDTYTHYDSFIIKLYLFFIEQFNIQSVNNTVAFYLQEYIKNFFLNSSKVFMKLLQNPYNSYFTSMIGFFYEFGVGTKINEQMAFEMYARYNKKPIEIHKSNTKLLSYKNYFQENNYIIGQVSLGLMYLKGTKIIQKDKEKAFKLFDESAKKGSSLAQSCVGFCYSFGNGIKKDEKKAFIMDLKSADRKNPVGLFDAGYDFIEGIGTIANERKGFQCYLEAAMLGNVKAYDLLGLCYQKGLGIMKNEEKAFEWYKKGAEAGYSGAFNNVGYCHLLGIGCERDEKRSLEFYLKSAEIGNPHGALRVGRFYHDDPVIKKDIIKAVYWLSKAKKHGEYFAEEWLDEICEHLTR
ncbi:hypothetical protein Glove_14g31 [Diversispora epigaea]|uniref:Protein kinase domain-containing protein n=1 Tax=Diversispora epigaea TaxID=1348612 RepID=A0A397JP70_9GLOM|nr:hypothetical protein Glove_14g31 [Diversispora epigaea]